MVIIRLFSLTQFDVTRYTQNNKNTLEKAERKRRVLGGPHCVREWLNVELGDVESVYVSVCVRLYAVRAPRRPGNKVECGTTLPRFHLPNKKPKKLTPV